MTTFTAGDYPVLDPGDGPGTSTQTLNFYAFQVGFVEFRMGRAAVLAYVVFAIIMVATVGLIRVTRRSSE